MSAENPSKPGDRAILLQLNAVSEIWHSQRYAERDWDKKDPILLDLGNLGIRDLYYDGADRLYILAGELAGNKPGEHPPHKLWRYRLGQNPVFVMDIPQVPSTKGTASSWSAPEGICAIQVKGKKKLVIVYDSVQSGIYRVIDFP